MTGVLRLQELPEELILEVVAHLNSVDLANVAVVFELSKSLPSLRLDKNLWRSRVAMDPPAQRSAEMGTCPQLPPTMATWQGQWGEMDTLAQSLVKAAPDICNIFSGAEMAPIHAIVESLRRASRLLDESSRGAHGDYMGAWTQAKERAASAGLPLSTDAYHLIGDAMLRKARSYIFVHCHPQQVGAALDEAVAFSQTEGVALPRAVYDSVIRENLNSMKRTMQYARDKKYFEYVSLGAAVAFKASQVSGMPLPVAEGEAFVQACRERAGNLYATKDFHGASVAQALQDQAANWLAASQSGIALNFATEKFPTWVPYRATWRERLFNTDGRELVFFGMVAATGVAVGLHRAARTFR